MTEADVIKGLLLKSIRIKLGLTISEMSGELNIASPDNYMKYEEGKRKITPNMLRKIDNLIEEIG